MPLSTAVTAEIHWWFKYLKNTTQSLQDITVDCTIERDATEMDGMLQTDTLQLATDGVLWREIILMFWN